MKRLTPIQRVAHAVIVATALAAIAPPSFAIPGTMGGGNCSIWQKMKSAMTGVYCGYL